MKLEQEGSSDLDPGPWPRRLADWLLNKALPLDAYEVISGDLLELLANKEREKGRAASGRWYLKQALLSILAVRLARPRRGTHGDQEASRRGGRAANRKEGVLVRFLYDVARGGRMMVKRPGFSFLVVLLLGLGVGSTTAMWTVVRGVLLAPLPYHEPERLGLLRISVEGVDKAPSLSAPELVDFRERSTQLEDIAAQWSGWTVLRPASGDEQGAQRLKIGWVTSNLFPLLGTSPAMGRNFLVEEEEVNGPNKKTILSHHLWVRRFGEDPQILGKQVQLENGEYTVVGVMPQGFRSMLNAASTNDLGPDLWIPNTYWEGRDVHWLRTVARLSPDATWDAAREEVATITAQLNEEFSEYQASPATFHLDPLEPELTASVRPALTALSGMTLLVLFIAIANTAALFLARGEGIRQEVATRLALGGSRNQVLRGLVAETLPVAATAGVLGAALAFVASELLVRFRPVHLPRVDEVVLTPAAIVLALILSVGCTLVAGILPMSRMANRGLGALMHHSRRLRDGGGLGHSSLLVAQIAMAFVLLIGAGLLVRSLDRVFSVDTGFETAGVTTVRLNVPTDRYESELKRYSFLSQFESALVEHKDIDSAGAVNLLPLSGGLLSGRFESLTADGPKGDVDYRMVTPGYLDTIGAELLEGRGIEEADIVNQRRVLLIDEMLADRLWPDRSALGRQIKVGLFEGDNLEASEVVGVVRHLRSEGVRTIGRPQVHLPYNGQTPIYFAVASNLPSGVVGELMKTSAHTIDDAVPVENVRSFSSYFSENIADLGFAVSVVGVFALLGLSLMLAGTYGVVTYWVWRRVPTMGLRMALGAEPRHVAGLVMARGLWPCVVGSVLGIVLALVLTRFLSALLFEVSPLDGATYLAVAAAVLFAAALASLVPARRAAGLDPATALRE